MAGNGRGRYPPEYRGRIVELAGAASRQATRNSSGSLFRTGLSLGTRKRESSQNLHR